MQTKILTTLAVFAALVPATAFAQAEQPTTQVPGVTTTTGAVGGAVTGAVVGGPIGAVVGGVIGASIGAAAEPPAEVRTFVMAEPLPAERVSVQVVEGQPLPATVQVRAVPKYPQYGYAIVDNRRVIVEPKTRQVIKIYQ